MDACVLYPAPLRDFLMELAASKLYRAKWTEKIQSEWMENLLENRPDLDAAKLERTRELMELAVPDCLVTGYEDLVPAIKCPDPNDRHVIAAAIRGGCSAIITTNLRDFPLDELKKYDLEAQHPDEFLFHQAGLNQAAVLSAARNCRLRLQNPKLTAEEYLQTFLRQGLPKTFNALAKYASII